MESDKKKKGGRSTPISGESLISSISPTISNTFSKSTTPNQSLIQSKPTTPIELVTETSPSNQTLDTQLYDSLTDVQRFLLTLTFMDKLNNLPIGEEQKKVIIEKLKYVSVNQIKNNSQRLIDIGVLPPFEDELVGGADGVLGKRASKPSQVAVEAAEAAEAARLKREANKENKERIAQEKAQIEEAFKTSKFDINDILEVIISEDAQYENLPNSAKILVQNVCNSQIASKFRDILFPEKAINEWCSKPSEEEEVEEEVEEEAEEEKEKCNARQIWELTGPQQQCKNVIGEFKYIPKGDIRKNCYICGFEIKSKAETIKKSGLNPECEHILPIIQAMFFLDLYRPNDKKLCNERVLTEQECNEITETLKEEYAWAHSTCNQVKSDKSFLKTTLDKDKYPSWDFSENNTKNLLYTIANTTRRRSGEVIQNIRTYPGGIDKWVESRVEELRKIMKPIVTRIQSRGNGGFIAIIGLRNCLNVNKLNTNLRLVLGNYGYNPKQLSPSSRTLQSNLGKRSLSNTSEEPSEGPSAKRRRFGGTRTNKKRSLKLMKKGGVARQRKLTEYGKMFKESLAKKEASNVKRKLTRKANAEVDELADIFGKLGTSPKKQTTSSHDIEMKYGGKKRRLTRRKSKKVSK